MMLRKSVGLAHISTGILVCLPIKSFYFVGASGIIKVRDRASLRALLRPLNSRSVRGIMAPNSHIIAARVTSRADLNCGRRFA
jgi:hypothetical protein